MNPLIYDIRRWSRAPAIWLAIALLVIVPGIIVSATPPTINNQSVQLNFAVTVTYSTHYDFAFCVFDGAGEPVSGVRVSVTLSNTTNSTSPPVGNVSGVTTAAGFANLVVSAPAARYSATYSASTIRSITSVEAPLAKPQGNYTIGGPGVITTVEVGNFSLTPYLLVAFPGPGGQLVNGLTLDYFINESGGTGSSSARNYSGSLGTISSTPELFHFAPPPEAGTQFPVVFQIVNSSGSVLASESFAISAVTPNYGADEQAGQILSEWVQGMEFLSLASGALIGYIVYGRDRISGALEPIIALPLGRTQVVAIRFVTAATLLAVGTTGSVILLVWWLSHSLMVDTPTPILAAAWIGPFAAGVAILGIVFLLSHVSRSHATVLGGGLALAAIFSLFWSDLTSVIAGFIGVPPSIQSMAQWQGSVGLLSPGKAMTNTVGWGISAVAPNGSQIFQVSPYPILAFLAISLWIVLPLLGVAYFARYRD
jgi:hypothetical protein